MIATVEHRPNSHGQAPQSAQEQAAHPLRRGEHVCCPKCGAEGEAWEWELKRTPRYGEWTVACYRCRTCSYTFALRPE